MAVKDWRMSNIFTREERVALELTEAMTDTPAIIPDDVFSDLQIHFNESQIVELVATVAMENYRARFNRAFLIQSQGIYKPTTSK